MDDPVYFIHSAVVLCEITKVPEIHVKSLNHDVSSLKNRKNHYQIRNCCSIYLLDYVHKFWQETNHFCRSYIKTSNGPKFADPRTSHERPLFKTYYLVLYLYIYIALLAVHINQKRFQCERPREKIASSLCYKVILNRLIKNFLEVLK